MEIRLNKRAKMKQLFEKLNIKSDLDFKSIFKHTTSQKILFHYLDELESKRPLLLDFTASSDKELLAALRVNNPELGARQILGLFGLKKALELVNL